MKNKNKEHFWTGDGLWERSKRLDPIPQCSIEEASRALDNKISAAGEKTIKIKNNMTDILSRKDALLKEQEALKVRRREINLELGKIEEELIKEQEHTNSKVGKYYKNAWTEELMKIISYNAEDNNYSYLGIQITSYTNGNWNVSFVENTISNWDLSQECECTEISEEQFMCALQKAVDYTAPLSKALQNYNCLGVKE